MLTALLWVGVNAVFLLVLIFITFWLIFRLVHIFTPPACTLCRPLRGDGRHTTSLIMKLEIMNQCVNKKPNNEA